MRHISFSHSFRGNHRHAVLVEILTSGELLAMSGKQVADRLAAQDSFGKGFVRMLPHIADLNDWGFSDENNWGTAIHYKPSCGAPWGKDIEILKSRKREATICLDCQPVDQSFTTALMLAFRLGILYEAKKLAQASMTENKYWLSHGVYAATAISGLESHTALRMYESNWKHVAEMGNSLAQATNTGEIKTTGYLELISLCTQWDAEKYQLPTIPEPDPHQSGYGLGIGEEKFFYVLLPKHSKVFTLSSEFENLAKKISAMAWLRCDQGVLATNAKTKVVLVKVPEWTINWVKPLEVLGECDEVGVSEKDLVLATKLWDQKKHFTDLARAVSASKL